MSAHVLGNFYSTSNSPRPEGAAKVREQGKSVCCLPEKWSQSCAWATSRGAGGMAASHAASFSVGPAQGQLPVPAGAWTSMLPTATWTTWPCCPLSCSLPAWHQDVLIAFPWPLPPLASPPLCTHCTCKVWISFLMLADVKSLPPTFFFIFLFSPSKGEQPEYHTQCYLALTLKKTFPP